jgi:hypothetical protein
MENRRWKMIFIHGLSPAVCLVLLLGFAKTAAAQSCSPVSVSYIVRDEKGTPLSEEDLKTVAEQLPKQVGDATTSASETSFAPDARTYYWQESVEWEKGNRMPSLQFYNAGICAMHFGDIALMYRGKTMRLVFDIDIARYQPDRRPVVDSLPFQNGTFRLDLVGWTHDKDKVIPASRWKKFTPPRGSRRVIR